MSEKPFIPFAIPDISEAEIDEVVDTIRSGWLTTGPKTRIFETRFAEYLGGGNAIAVNSATAGMHLALEALGVGPGDKVVVPVYTFTATAEVVRYLGADPLFVDVEPDTKNIDCDALERLLETNNVKVVMPVDFAGAPVDLDRVIELAHGHGASVVEDAAHAFPTKYRGRWVGSIADVTVFSFYATKTLAVGEGGMILTADDELAARMRVMRLHGISRDVFDRYTSKKPSWYYEVIAPGFKYNMTDVAASLGLHQLRRAEELQQGRQAIAMKYLDAFADLPVTLPVWKEFCDLHAWHLFVMELHDDAPVSRDEFIAALADAGIGTSVHFIPLHMHPYWRDTYELKESDFPVAARAFHRVVSLPIYTRMTDADVARVIAMVRNVLGMS